MPDEKEAAQVAEGQEQVSEEERQEQASEVDAEEFDKARAMATIRNLRAYERQAKTLKKELETLKQKQEDAGRTELEKLTVRLADAERRAIDAEQRIAQVEIRADFMARALQEGVTDARLAYLAAQSDGLLGSYDDGEISSHDFKALRKGYPHLFRPVGSADGSAGSGRPPTSGGMNEFIRKAAGR